ncbi:hypothetical protein BDR07DRAFT_1481457 [Suillus spraguei]|nr:hypothetical protein BDR07DRAFT_1481457 [Suillus spraguei]
MVLFDLVTIILNTSNKSCPKSSHTFRHTTAGGSATHSAVYPAQSRPLTPFALLAKCPPVLLNPYLNIWAPSLASGRLSCSSNHLPSAVLSLCGISPAIPSFRLTLFLSGWSPSALLSLCGISPAIPSFRFSPSWCPSTFLSLCGISLVIPSTVWYRFCPAGALLPSSASVVSLRPFLALSDIIFAWLAL